ncbi:MAG: hypothetical protein LAQ69_30625 [Acidobacteriia bacterium]|nr:hypothetical protein [Terriglobia bacterium]
MNYKHKHNGSIGSIIACYSPSEAGKLPESGKLPKSGKIPDPFRKSLPKWGGQAVNFETERSAWLFL